jgi:hypothetical protein
VILGGLWVLRGMGVIRSSATKFAVATWMGFGSSVPLVPRNV